MKRFEYFLLLVLWGGAIISAIVGRISTPMLQMNRKDNPLQFWSTYAILMIVVVILTVATIVY